jgi:AbrB family looped-hinge helix DNA binding protein
MRITSNGRVTIPAEIRNRLGLHPGSVVEFEVDGEAVRIRKVADADESGHGRDLVDHMRGRATAGLSTDELMALTRG